MKNKWILVIGVALVFGLAFMACDTGTGGDDSINDPFEGTWLGMFGTDKVRIVAENGSFKEYVDTHGVDDLEEDYRGSYTYDGNAVTMKITEVRESSGWVSYADSVEFKPPQNSFTGTISGSTMVFTSGMALTLTKQ